MTSKTLSVKGRLVWPLGIGLLWLLFLFVLALWSVRSERSHVLSMAEREAKAFFQQIVVTRAWNAAHGGVYVLTTSENPPNPFLKAEDQTIETLQGLTLTKVNPAYMTRQLSTIAENDHEVQFHITSLDPIRPANMADAWEAQALQEISRGSEEKFELVEGKAGKLFRFIAPLHAEKQCMRCHAAYGHADKEILGGISVSFAAAPLIQARKSSVAQTHIAFSLIFLVGFVGICGSTYQIQKKREEAEKANRTKSVFLANMSHDMRTPLNGIMGMTELMQKKGLGQTQERYADMVRHSAWTLLEIITDITDFSRLESGRLELSEKTFDIRKMLSDSLNIFRFESANKGLSLNGEVDAAIPQLLKGDAFRLKQVVTNLVGNAVKFTQTGHVSVRIVFEGVLNESGESADEKIRLRVEVEDTGIGIPEEEQQYVFESFRQVDDSYAKTHEGSGLGLAICSQLVTMMGGTISVASKPGHGSIFSFDITVGLPGEGETDQGVKDIESNEIPSVSPSRILVAEDNPLNQTFAKEILEEGGHLVTIAENGAEAIECIRKEAYDLVFMDVQMPIMDGLEATRIIRAGEAGEAMRTIPIIAATAFAVQGDKEKCLDAGMSGYVVKPLSSHDLLTAVGKYVGNHDGEKQKGMTQMPPESTVTETRIDMDAALARLGNKRALFDKLVVAFMDDTPPKLADLAEHVAVGNLDEILRLSHGLKNSAGMVQAVAMAEVAGGIEMAVRQGRLTEVPELFDRLQKENDSAMAALSALLEA